MLKDAAQVVLILVCMAAFAVLGYGACKYQQVQCQRSTGGISIQLPRMVQLGVGGQDLYDYPPAPEAPEILPQEPYSQPIYDVPSQAFHDPAVIPPAPTMPAPFDPKDFLPSWKIPATWERAIREHIGEGGRIEYQRVGDTFVIALEPIPSA